MSKQAITELVAALAVEAESVLIPVYEPDEFKRSVESADCPARIILPSTEGDMHSLEPKGYGQIMHMTWVVKDLLLYRPVEEGMGWYEVGYALDGYIDSYAAKLAAANHSTTGFCAETAEVLGVEFNVGVFTYPVGGARSYYGVMATLRILEVM